MKEQMTEKAIELFARKGFKETSIQDIVDSLGVTKGTFYYYFTSKDSLLMEIHTAYIEKLLIQQEQLLEDRSKSVQEKLYSIVYSLIQDIGEHGQSARVFIREMRNLNDNDLEKVIPLRDKFRENIEELIQEGVEYGEFRDDLSVDIVTFGILGMANWSYLWYQMNGRMTEEEVTKVFMEMILNGLKK
ncbi:TetR family transcriptional regulator [Bacillus coahuilensis m2-6]|uniref:TetR family transcriptional regulator n=1 Tax=Bacillus coahuilensis p1.1.43 TaxID=1150625 RepID=A0A147KB35_9BACI|nr:TetR/AcrR family transcriptional regulator [Bacillus coahuilensis]KUP08102.1 TetR family transcriptional regulator [Bacillus coahuilensis p1.1.43]KUP09552.1 TetR family transcriptional regulator [Bacillus coahuilensis m2-6]